MQKLFLLCLVLWAVPSFGAEINIDFRNAVVDQTPTNFQGILAGTGQSGTWTIVTDEVPPLLAPLTDKAPEVSKRPVLAQTSTDQTDEHFPILLYTGETFKDFKLSTRFKIVSGVAEQMAGVVFRFQNASNFYVVRASAMGRNVRFYKVVNGVRSAPIGPQLDITTGKWHTLAVQCAGIQITFWLDDVQLLPALGDNTFGQGKIGFWTKSDSVSYFSDLHIDYTPVIPTAQTLVNNIMQQETRLLGLRIYALDAQGEARVIASKDASEVGSAGGASAKAAKTAITNGTVSFGREPGTVAVWLPFRDRNGDPMAAVWVRLKSFFGETQENAVTRATQIIKLMQAQVTSNDELLK